MPRPAAVAVSLVLVLAGVPVLAQPSARFDFDKTVAYGEGRGAINTISQDDAATTGACETVEIASPPLRLARTARGAKLESRALDPAVAKNAARSTLSTLYTRRPFQTQNSISRGRDRLAPDALNQAAPCGESRRPTDLHLVNRAGASLEPLHPLSLEERPGTGKFFASKTTLLGIAEFDLESALALEGGEGLEVRVIYADGKPGSFRFQPRQVKELYPSWSR